MVRIIFVEAIFSIIVRAYFTNSFQCLYVDSSCPVYTKFQLEATKRTRKATESTFYDSLLGRVTSVKWAKGSRCIFTITEEERDELAAIAAKERMK